MQYARQHGLGEAAIKYRVSYTTLDRWFRVEGERPPKHYAGLRSSSFRILAALINTVEPACDIADRMGVTRQRVEQISTLARGAGIRLHPQRRLKASVRKVA